MKARPNQKREEEKQELAEGEEQTTIDLGKTVKVSTNLTMIPPVASKTATPRSDLSSDDVK